MLIGVIDMGRISDFLVDTVLIKTVDSVMWFADDAVDFVKENPIKTTAVVAATVATGGAFAAAPIVAATIGGAGYLGATATTGTVISSLSGAALTNASLAALGGGALSTGAAGMAGGTALVSAAGGVSGAVAGGGSAFVASQLPKD